jgi:predicted glycoside hydrolase/deacetylase ChbG (UPF0249 family)
MLIINADDWGRSPAETNSALDCFCSGRITSVTAMVFMGDSTRAADLAKEHGIEAGLHLNLNQPYTGCAASAAHKSHRMIAKFLNLSKFTVLLYHPLLRERFREVFEAQIEEFVRLYGKQPTHVDGHQHKHLCANVLRDEVIPRGFKIRRNFSFWPGEKGFINRAYRRFVDKKLSQRYGLTDFFFSLSECLRCNTLDRVSQLAKAGSVELMTHPVNQREYAYLKSGEYLRMISGIETGTYAQLEAPFAMKRSSPF